MDVNQQNLFNIYIYIYIPKRWTQYVHRRELPRLVVTEPERVPYYLP